MKKKILVIGLVLITLLVLIVSLVISFNNDYITRYKYDSNNLIGLKQATFYEDKVVLVFDLDGKPEGDDDWRNPISYFPKNYEEDKKRNLKPANCFGDVDNRVTDVSYEKKWGNIYVTIECTKPQSIETIKLADGVSIRFYAQPEVNYMIWGGEVSTTYIQKYDTDKKEWSDVSIEDDYVPIVN